MLGSQGLVPTRRVSHGLRYLQVRSTAFEGAFRRNSEDGSAGAFGFF